MRVEDSVKFNIPTKDVEYYLDKIKNNESLVVITGEFSSGKTCFLNAFLGKEDFLSHSNAECTPVLLDIMNSDEDYLLIKYKDGTEKKEDAVKENIDKYTKYTGSYDTSILSISIPVKSPYIINNTHIIDSPGTNTIIKEHEEITNYILKKADIVIYVLNKTISNSDLECIKGICKYNEDIFFVVTHIDEIDETQKATGRIYKSEEQIERLVSTITRELKDKLGLENAEVFPIGSKAAFTDVTYIKEIRECVKGYIELNGINVMKNRVKKQLSIIFEERLSEIEKETKFYTTNINMESHELQNKINSLNAKIIKMEDKSNLRFEEIEICSENEKLLLKSDVEILFEKERVKLLQRILKNNDVTTEIIEEEFNSTRISIGEVIKEKLEIKISNLLKYVYTNMNTEIIELLNSIDIKLEANIREPIMEELDDSNYSNNVEDIIRMRQRCLDNLVEMEEEIACTEVGKEEIRSSIRELDQLMESYKSEMNKIGVYVPKYEEVVISGGGESGARFGRVLGEVADIGLMFFNPAGAAATGAKAVQNTTKVAVIADNVKDTIKAISYIEKVSSMSKKPAEIAYKIKVNVEKSKKILIAANEAKNKIAKKGEELIEHTDNPNIISQIGKALDMLSIGYWGEKIGQTIGESINSTRTILVENEEYKIEIEKGRRLLQEETSNYRIRKLELEEDYKNADSIRKKRQVANELKNKKDYYEQLIRENEEKFKKQKHEDINIQIERYYTEEVSKIFEKDINSAKETMFLVFNLAKEKIINKSKEDLSEKILQIQENILSLSNDKTEINNQIDENQILINELRNYNVWIEQWVNEYAGI